MDYLDRPLTLPAALDRAAREHPDRVAYVEWGAGGRREVRWSRLANRARETAAGLIALGLRRGDRVAICAENSVDWVVAYLATALAGGTGVLVYYELKPPEIREQVSRPASRFLVASRSVLAKLPEGVPGVDAVIVAGEDDGTPAAGGTLPLERVRLAASPADHAALPGRAPAPDDLAAIIYTSGTTGGPKGVMLSQRNFLSNGSAAIEALDVGRDDSVLLVLPLHHAMPFLACVVLPALCGARIVIENDLRRIRERLQSERPTVFFGVPALYELMYRSLLARAESEGRLAMLRTWQRRLGLVKRLTGVNLAPLVFRPIHKALGGRLRFLVSGGAALNPQTARDFFSLGLPLIQGWGMTEASPAVAVQRFSPLRFRFTRYYEDHVGSVGPPLPGVEVRLIDVPEKDIRVGVSGEGEVIVRGDNVFRGYWQAEEETREAMLDGWLRTGDLGRIDTEGNVYLTGRSKYVIVLESGEKVHPNEVEDKLSESDLLADVCVLGRKRGDGRDRTQVTAVIHPSVEEAQGRAAEASVTLDEASLRRLVASEVERLGRDLAAYKRVSRIELADQALPKTALRKVARGLIAEEYAFDFETWLASGEAETTEA